MMMESRPKSPFAWLVMFSIGVLASCAGPPLDALQSAEDALDRASLAEECATEEYRAAQRLLEDAQAASTRGDYDRALQLAQAAEEQAELARLTAEANLDECEERLGLRDSDDDSLNGHNDDFIITDYEMVPIYFSFDSSRLSAENRQVLDQHARYVIQNGYGVHIEGHCDHFGTEAYNVALGERRARTVRDYLIQQGVEPSQISTVSWGEYRPASMTDTSENRRAEFRLRE